MWPGDGAHHTWPDEKNMVLTYNQVLLSHKGQHHAIFRETEETEDHHAKRDKADQKDKYCIIFLVWVEHEWGILEVWRGEVGGEGENTKG